MQMIPPTHKTNILIEIAREMDPNLTVQYYNDQAGSFSIDFSSPELADKVYIAVSKVKTDNRNLAWQP